MDFRGDERAVTVQIGAVLLLGFLVVTLSLYQATVVPDQNSQVEFQHNQRVQADMQEVRNAILGTAATESSAPVGVELGTRYPSRVVAVNPAPPSGSLSTTTLGNISIQNAEANDSTTATADYPETDDFWDGTPRNYTTTSLVYQPNYANFQNAPTTVYENGVVYNRFRSGNLTLTGQPVVAGSRISLIVLSGDLSRSGSGTLTVDPRAVSVSTRTVSISNDSDGGDVSVVLPSRLDNETWEGLLDQSGQYDPDNSSDTAHVYAVENRPDGVELFFEPGVTYQLKLSKVGVGTNIGTTEPAYLTSVDDLVEQPFEDRTYPFVVESRDRYNNPVPANVLAASERTSIPNGVTVEPGRYRYQYTAPAPGDDWVNITYRRAADGDEYNVRSTSFDGSLPENVQYTPEIQSAAGGGGGDGGDGGSGGPDPGGDNAFGSLSQQSFSGGPDQGYVKFTVTNQEASSLTIESISIDSDGANRIFEQQGGSDEGNTEMYLASDGSSTFYESGDSDGDYYTLGNTRQLSSSITVNSGSDLTVTFAQFRNGGSEANMENDQVSVTFYYSDANADPTTVTFQVQP
ncbi:hypothetical protein [Halobellus clavatus]|uniref:Uncharacterized protein n=1 Tax=Halobellus clavatus TaxID=660517 RepID=A0A1H3JP77_9EURY|nr:hypothetical protein [Halobellus clavatus]SDY41335.1 hypothetical protein SAMN04487946_11473 [Halobellus clavatus]